MFEFVKGVLEEVGNNHVVVEVNGIGFYVVIPKSDLLHIYDVGKHIKLYTHLVVKEDTWELYGFLEKESKSVFEKLITVSGVGPKVALSVLANLNPEQVAFAIAAEDEKLLSKVPGIGRKTAQRLIMELKDKMNLLIKNDETVKLNLNKKAGTNEADAIKALLALGYDATEAYSAVKSSYDSGLDVTDIVKRALRSMDKR